MLASFKRNIGALAALSAVVWAGNVANAQTLIATVTQPPSGPNSTAKVALAFDPAGEGDINFSGFNFAVLYDPALGSLTDANPLQQTNAYTVAGAEQNSNPEYGETPAYPNFKVVDGDEYVDTAPDPDVAYPWSSSSSFVELVFTMSPTYTSGMPFSFDIEKYGSNAMIAGEGITEVNVNTITIPPSVYDSPVLAGISKDGTWRNNGSETLTLTGTGFYDGTSGSPSSQVIFDGPTVDAIVTPTVNSYSQMTLTVPTSVVAQLDQYTVRVSNGSSPFVDSATKDFYVLSRDSVFVDDSYTAEDGRLVASGPLDLVLGVNAFKTISDGATAVNTKTVTVPGAVNIAAGSYYENVVVAKPLSIIGADSGTVIMGSASAATQQQLITVNSNGVAISGVGFIMDNTVGGGIVALGRTDLSVSGCEFILPADATGGKTGSGTLASGGWGPKGIMFRGVNATSSNVTLTNNEFANLTPNPADSYYQYAMHVELATGSITGNKSIGAYRDLFLSQAAGLISGNTFAMNVDVSNPAAPVTIANNDFGRTSLAFPGAPDFWHNEAALTVRAVQAGRSVTIDNNDFENTARGVWVGASQNVLINNNRFTPSDLINIDLGDQTSESANEYSHIIIDSKAVSSSTPSATTNYVTVANNTFNGSAAGGHGLEFRNPVAGSTFSLSFASNEFNSNLDEFVHVGANFSNEINLTNNTVSVNSETGTPSALALASLFALEDKTHHKLDSDGGPALVRWVAGNVYVTNNSGSIQRGVNAAAANNTVNVKNASYSELVEVATAGLKLIGNGLPNVLAPGSAQNNAVIKVVAANVRVEGFHVTVNQADAAVGIAAPVAAAAGVEIIGNTVTTIGSGAAAVSGLLPFGQVAGISVMNPSGNSMPATVSGNIVGTELAPFKTFGIAFERCHGTVANNTIYGEDFDLLTRFVNNGATLNITGNNFNGWGDESNKGAQVEVGDLAWATVKVTGNTFTPRAGTSPNEKVNRRSLQLKNHYSDQTDLEVSGNTFNVLNTGLALTNVYDAAVSGNIFNGVADNALLLEINNKIYSSADSHQDFDVNNATIQGNTFKTNGLVSGVKAIEFRDHTQGNVPHPTVEIAFANYVIGGAGAAANIFKNDLTYFLRLDDSVGNTSAHPAYVNTPFVSVMEPVSESFVAKANLFNVGSGDKLPSAMELAEVALLNGKIYDRRDNPALGSVLLFERVTNTNTNEKFDYVQDAINDPATVDGHTITAAAGSYPESNGPNQGLIINKSVTVQGPNAGVAGSAVRTAEAVILPGTLLNGGTTHNSSNAVVMIHSANVAFSGFKVSGDNPELDGLEYAGMDLESASGIRVVSIKPTPADPYPAVDNVTIANNIVSDLTYAGILYTAYNSPADGPRYYGARIQGNLVENVQDYLANGWGYGMILQAVSGIISENKITNVRKGMQLQPYRVSTALAGENMVISNVIEPWSIGIYYNYQDAGSSKWTIGGAGSDANTITAFAVPVDLLPNVPWEGIRVENSRVGAAGGDITGNIIDASIAMTDIKHLNWNDYGAIPAVWGMRLIDAHNEAIAFTDNSVSNVQFGFLQESDSNIPAAGFEGNTFAVAGGGEYIRLQKFRANDGTIGTAGGAGNIDATNGNTYGTVASGSAALADLYAIEDKIMHTMDNADLGLVRVVDQNLYVTINTEGIQRGIDAATAGDTVNVAAGEYTEAGFYDAYPTYAAGVTIEKALKLYGPNVNVSASSGATRFAEAVILPDAELGALGTDNPVLGVAADNVEVKGFTIKGDNTLITSSNEVAGMDLEASTGIMTEGNNLQVANNIVDGASLVGIRSAGYWANNATYPNFVDVHLTGNFVKNVHNASGSGYGLYMQGSMGSVNSNKVENVRRGIQVQPYNNVGSLEVKSNNIAAWQWGLWFNTESTTGNWAFEDNVIAASLVPATLGVKTLWEGIRIQLYNSATANIRFEGNSIDGLIAQGDVAHDNVGEIAEGVWGINYFNGLSINVVLDDNTAENVTVALVHSAGGDLTLANNDFSASSVDVIRIQKETSDSGVVSLTAGGTKNISVANNNTLNGLSTGDTTLSNQFNIEDLITHKLDDSSLGLARVVEDHIYVTPDSGSITRGVEAADAGDIVHVEAGASYPGAAIDKLVGVVSGENSGTKAEISGAVAINIPAGTGAVNVGGFAFTGSGSVAVNGVDQDSATFSFTDSTFTGSTAQAAVGVQNAKNGLIQEISITGGTGESIILANVNNVDVKNSTITHNLGSGISLYKWDLNGASPETIDGVDIVGNTIKNNGVVLTGETVTDVSNYNAYGILVGRYDSGTLGNVIAPSAMNIVIDDNVIENNAATGVFLSGLSSDDIGNNVVENNTIHANGWAGVYRTVLSDKNTDGVKINGSRNLLINNNHITANKRYGVQVRSLPGSGQEDAGEGVALLDNHIFGNDPIVYDTAAEIGGGLLLQLDGNAAMEIAAENNWWGHVYGPYVAGENENGRGDAIDAQAGVAIYEDWYGKRSYAQRWKALNDRDGDGLLDAEEDPNLLIVGDTVPVAAAAANDKDSDNDGYEDGVEVMLGSDAFDDQDVPTYTADPLVDVSTVAKDKDGDNYWDFYEVAVGTEPSVLASFPDLGQVSLSDLRQVIVLNLSIYSKSPLVEADKMDLNRDGAVSNLDAIALRRFLAGTVKLPLDVQPQP